MVQPVKRITSAPTMTPIEPSMSAHTSRYAPFTLRLVPLPAFSSFMEIRFTTNPITATTNMPVDATSGGSRNRPTASQRM